MIIPTMGKRKTTRHQRILWETGRFDWRTSTAQRRQQLVNHSRGWELTPDENIKDQNNESDNSTAGTIMPGFGSARADGIISDGSSKGKRRKPELEEGNDSVVEHFDG